MGQIPPFLLRLLLHPCIKIGLIAYRTLAVPAESSMMIDTRILAANRKLLTKGVQCAGHAP
jgi:hypothetical protein